MTSRPAAKSQFVRIVDDDSSDEDENEAVKELPKASSPVK